MILGHPLLGAQVAEHRVLVQIVSSHNENNCTHLCFVRKRSPRDFFSILLGAIEQLASPDEAADIVHGTTVGTNTLLERKGAHVAFVTTAGFEDTLGIGRQARPRLYDLFASTPPPLAPPELRFGVAERTAPDGTPLIRLTRQKLQKLRRAVAAARPEAIAISLLFCFANPAHERAVAAALKPLGVPLSVSHEVLPEFREYERASTVAVNAYLAPRMAGYLAGLERRVKARLAGGSVRIMQSGGGITRATVAAREPVRTVLSGPVGGVVGAHAVARRCGINRVISFDMGGTSTDVALVEGAPRITTESALAGMPIAVPMLDIHSVGAGGGSLARVDSGGALRVGPESAGADPGPICYGRGKLPTVTDANLLLGRLDSELFLGGEVRLDQERTRRLFEQFVRRHSRHLRSVPELAVGIVRVANASMEKAIRVISVERGHDPRDFTLVAFGGAGGLHACALAAALRFPRVLVPQNPGALSALGILFSDTVKDYSRTVMLPPEQTARLARHFAELERQGRAEMRREGAVPHELEVTCTADLRYVGQGYELNVPWQSGSRRTARPRDQLQERFHRAHQAHYGYADQDRPVEVVNIRVRLTVPGPPLPLRAARLRAGDGRQARVVRPAARFPVYRRDRLQPGDRLKGPAVIAEYSATTFLPEKFTARVDALSNLLIQNRRGHYTDGENSEAEI